MMSRKWMVGLMTVVMIMALAPSSFAQIELRLFNTAAANEIATDRHVRSSDTNSVGAGILVSGVLVANSTLTTTTLTLTFPATITSSAVYPSTFEGIQIVGATGVFATVAGFVTSTATSLSVSLPGFPVAPGNSESGSFRITGVRLDGTGLSGSGINLSSAVLSSSSNNYIAPTNLPLSLIGTVSAGLGALSAGPTITGTASVTGAGTAAGTVTIFTNQTGATPSDDNATITLAEGFANAWRTATENSVNGTVTGVSGNGIRFTVSGLPPGMTATITPAPGGVTFGTAAVALTSAATSGTLLFAGTVSPTITSTKSFSIVVTGAPTAALAGGTSIGLTATMATVAGTGSLTAAGSAFPKFTASETASFTIGSVIVAKTTMLIPYAVSLGTGGSQYNTGVAIANTTKDPFGTGSATQTNGIISFSLFARTSTGAGATATVTTGPTVLMGSGLATDGELKTGGLFTGLLSEILAKQTAITGDFSGYLFIETNFLNAHGTAYLMTGGTISSGLPILVLPPPAATTRNTGGVESLGF